MKTKSKSQFSVVNGGPIKYFNSWFKARAFASKCLTRGYVIDPDTKKHNPIRKGGLMICNLTTGSEQMIDLPVA